MWINRDTEAQRRVRYLYIVQIALTLKFQKRRTRERQIVRRDNKGYVSRNRSPTRDACVPLSWLPNQVRPQRSIVVFGERGWEAEKNICQPSFFSRRHTRFFPSVTPNVFPDVTPGFISSVALDFNPDLTPIFFRCHTRAAACQQLGSGVRIRQKLLDNCAGRVGGRRGRRRPRVRSLDGMQQRLHRSHREGKRLTAIRQYAACSDVAVTIRYRSRNWSGFSWTCGKIIIAFYLD